MIKVVLRFIRVVIYRLILLTMVTNLLYTNTSIKHWKNQKNSSTESGWCPGDTSVSATLGEKNWALVDGDMKRCTVMSLQ